MVITISELVEGCSEITMLLDSCVLFRIPITVIVPDDRRDFTDEVIVKPGSVWRRFIPIPSSPISTCFKVNLYGYDESIRGVYCIGKSWFNLKPTEDSTFKWFRSTDGNIAEVLICLVYI